MSYSNPVIKEIIRERLMSMTMARLNEEQKALVKVQLNEFITNAAAAAVPGKSRWGRWGGPLLAGVVQGVDSASSEWDQNKEKGLSDTENTRKTWTRGGIGGVGAAAGAWAGIKAGAAGGAAAGSLFGGIGAVPGAIIGATVLGIAGAWAGGKIGDSIGDKITNIGEDPAAHKKFKEDAIKTEGDQRQKDADERWAPKYGSSTDNGFGRPPKKGFGERSSRTSYQNLGGRGQSQEFSIGGAGSVDFSASQTQWDNSNYNGNRAGGPGAGEPGAGEPGAGDAGEDSSASSKTRYPTPGINFGGPITLDSVGPAKEELVTSTKKSSTRQFQDALRKWEIPQEEKNRQVDLTNGLGGLEDERERQRQRSPSIDSVDSAAEAARWETRLKRMQMRVGRLD